MHKLFQQSQVTPVNTPLRLLWQGAFSALKKNATAPEMSKQALDNDNAYHENTCKFIKT
jgi:hypothetical protein